MPRPSSLILACGLLCSAGAARAQTTSYTLFYMASEDCPAADRFAAELSARAPWLVQADGPAPLAIEVSFEKATPLTGVLVLRDAEGQTTTRAVPGATCAEVVSALALITTVLIDAQRSESTAPLPPPAAAPAPAPERPPPRAARRHAPEPSHIAFGFGAGTSVNSGVAPSTTLAGALELSAEWSTPSLLSPLASLGAESTLPSDTSNSGGAASFRWSVLRANACPLRLRVGAAFVFRPCAMFEGGVLQADGSGIDAATSASAPWWSIGAAARGELAVLPPLAVGLEAGARYHLRRDSFYFASRLGESTVFAVPQGGAFARLFVHAHW